MEAVEEEQPQEEEEEAEEGEGEEEEEEEEQTIILRSSFPMGRVKKIIKLDRDIKKVTSEALLLISLSADLFLGFLAGKARDVAIDKKRKTIKVDHLRSAVQSHQPTSDFLLDCLPNPSQPPPQPSRVRSAPTDKPLPPGARRIDQFFQKPSVVVPE